MIDDPTRNDKGELVRDDSALRDLCISTLTLLDQVIDITEAGFRSANERIQGFEAIKREIAGLKSHASTIDVRKETTDGPE